MSDQSRAYSWPTSCVYHKLMVHAKACTNCIIILGVIVYREQLLPHLCSLNFHGAPQLYGAC